MLASPPTASNRHVRLGLLLPLLLLPLACGDEAAPPEPVVRPIKILELGGDASEQVLEFPGTVKAGQSAEMAFEVAGRIEELAVFEGQEVATGDVLARLDPRDFQSKVDAERAKERAAKAEYDRTLKLFQEKVTSQQQLDTRQRNYEVTRTNLERARKALEDARLVAPFAGIIARTDVENFENVQAKQVVLVLENDSVFEVEADIPEQDAARLPPNLSLDERTVRGKPEITVSALENRAFPARLTEFATTADPRTRTFAATLAFDNPGDVSLATGMTANVLFHVSDELIGETGLFVPVAAVTSDPSGQPIVWTVDPASMAVSARPVEVGTMSSDGIRVRSGLGGSEWIAISGVAFLHEGMVVSRAAN